MNIENLKQRYPALLDHMQKNGYSSEYIHRTERQIENILSEASKWDSYNDILNDFIAHENNSEKVHHFKTALNVIKRFDLLGLVPQGYVSSGSDSGSFATLEDEYKQLLEYYKTTASQGHLKPSTVHRQATNTASFLYKLQNFGCHSLADITEDIVLRTLTKENGEPAYSCSYTGQLRAVFRECIPWNNACRDILVYIPSQRKQRKNIQFFSATERDALAEAISSSPELTLRNKAIGSLLYYTGLRACDIAALGFEDINWETDTISIIQQKTSQPLMLPLSAKVGNAIYDYITIERPKSKDPHLFLSYNHPFGPISSGAINGVSNLIYKAANIRQSPGDRKGNHLFRHNLATLLLENGTDKAIISNVLGHSDPCSTEAYLSADTIHLKQCALSVETYPMKREVLNRE